MYQIGAVWKSESNSLIKVGRGTEFDHVFRSLPSSKQSQDTFTRVVHIIHTTKVTVWCWVTPKLTCITAGWKMMLLQATVVSLNCHLWRRNSSARRQYHIYTQGFYHHHWCCHFHGPPISKITYDVILGLFTKFSGEILRILKLLLKFDHRWRCNKLLNINDLVWYFFAKRIVF